MLNGIAVSKEVSGASSNDFKTTCILRNIFFPVSKFKLKPLGITSLILKMQKWKTNSAST